MTDVQALSIVRKFIDSAQEGDARVNISHSLTGWVVQRTGGGLPMKIRHGKTLGEAVDKVFGGTNHACI